MVEMEGAALQRISLMKSASAERRKPFCLRFLLLKGTELMCKFPSTERDAFGGIGLTTIFPVSLVMYWGYLVNMAGRVC